MKKISINLQKDKNNITRYDIEYQSTHYFHKMSITQQNIIHKTSYLPITSRTPITLHMGKKWKSRHSDKTIPGV